MARWTRDELEQAFEDYQAVALEAGVSGDWTAWADQFTLDATYKEHLYGDMGGREAIRTWISRTMEQNPEQAADLKSAARSALDECKDTRFGALESVGYEGSEITDSDI
ncbi:MAG: hypothetical protein AAEJ52_12655, partial [Myxococcota bacterium]